MIVALDVDYRPNLAVTACVGFSDWLQAEAVFEQVSRRPVEAAAYEPGAFYRRELPCLLDAIRALPALPSVAIVDGYVWLGPGRPGLGARLHGALDGCVAVVGVAKGPFRGATAIEPEWTECSLLHGVQGGPRARAKCPSAARIEVMRGTSRQPLYVTAEGMDCEEAAQAVRGMHGPHRMPTLLKRVDRLARDG